MQNSVTKSAIIFATLALIGCSNAGQIISNSKAGDGIVGGQDVSLEDPIARSTVALFSNSAGVCTGTLITQTLIVTAAHCVATLNDEITVVFDLKLDNWNPQNARPVIAVAMNSNYEKVVQLANTAPSQRSRTMIKYIEEVGWGDIALVRFGGTLPAGFAPVNILPDPRPLMDGTEITLAGFGRIDGLLPGQSQASSLPLGGTGTLRRVNVGIAKARFKSGEILIDQRQGGACRGDSGGPAFIKDKTGKYWLFGVISHGEGSRNSNCNVASAVTSVVTFIPWLEKMAPTLMLVDPRKSLRAGKYIPLRVTEADASRLLARP